MKENYDDIYDNDYFNLENDNIEDIFNIDIKSTSNESEQNDDFNNEENNSDDEMDLKYDNYDKFFEENNQKKYKNFQNIVCSECGEIPYIEIDHINYKIKSSCPNGHNKVETFINFIKKSNEKIDKGYECIECKKEISELTIKKIIKKIICTNALVIIMFAMTARKSTEKKEKKVMIKNFITLLNYQRKIINVLALVNLMIL